MNQQSLGIAELESVGKSLFVMFGDHLQSRDEWMSCDIEIARDCIKRLLWKINTKHISSEHTHRKPIAEKLAVHYLLIFGQLIISSGQQTLIIGYN